MSYVSVLGGCVFLVFIFFVICCVLSLLNCCNWQLSTVMFHTKQIVIMVVEQRAFFQTLREMQG